MTEYRLIQSEEELQDAFDTSHDKTVVLFKHSLTCPISSRALDAYRSFIGTREDDTVDFRLIEVQRKRDLSREVATRTGVRHESPQALVVRDGDVVWHDSHWRITVDALEKALN